MSHAEGRVAQLLEQITCTRSYEYEYAYVCSAVWLAVERAVVYSPDGLAQPPTGQRVYLHTTGF